MGGGDLRWVRVVARGLVFWVMNESRLFFERWGTKRLNGETEKNSKI